MDKREEYKGYILLCTKLGVISPKVQSACYVYRSANDDQPLFSEVTWFSRARFFSLKAGQTEITIQDDMLELCFEKAKARIDMGIFLPGTTYEQEYLAGNSEVDDEQIQYYILLSFRNDRKFDPVRYEITSKISVPGFCGVFSIPEKQFVYNAGVLYDEGLIQMPDIDQFHYADGHAFITTSGIRALQNLGKRISTPSNIPNEIKTEFSQEVSENQDTFLFEVCISFAGEDRDIAKAIVDELKKLKITVFYDDFEKHKLWGKNLTDHLQFIYGKAAKFCIMLLSANYANKLWTNHERQVAQARAFRQNSEYILPIRVDSTEIPGILETVGYLEWNQAKAPEIAKLAQMKLRDSQ